MKRLKTRRRATKKSDASYNSAYSARWKGLLAVFAVFIVGSLALGQGSDMGASLADFGKTQTTSACTYSIGIANSGSSSIAAGSSITFDLTAWPSGCTTETDLYTSAAYTSGPDNATTFGAPPICNADSPLKLPTTGTAKGKIVCSTSSGTVNGPYKFTANMTTGSGVSVQPTWFTFSVTGGKEICTGYNLSTDKSTYVFGDTVKLKYDCYSNFAGISNTLTFQAIPPNADSTSAQTITTLNGVSSGTFDLNTSSLSTKTSGSWILKTCINSTSCTSGTNSISVNINSTSTTGTTGGTGSANWVKKVWNFKDGQTSESYILNRTDSEYANYIAQVRAACLLINKTTTWKPNAGSDATDNWKNFGIPECSGSTTTPTASCTSQQSSSSCSAAGGCYWATKKSGTSFCQSTSIVENCTDGIDNDGDEYIDKEDPDCGGSGAVTPTTPSSCENGKRCPSGSWCQGGERFYYPNGDITCVAWSTGGTPVTAPEGTSECNPTDANCVATGQTVAYSSSKWCARGQSYYSTDGTKMACVNYSSTAPAGFSSCKPGDAQCIPSGGYGPSTGWCSNGMKFYQIAKDTNANNDVYCAPMPVYTTPGVSAMDSIVPPSGYSACSPTDTNCKQKGDTWTSTNSGYYCMNAQKCSSTTGGSCVGWNEQCPSGTKYCSSTDNYCVEPGETKTITATSTVVNYGSYWCGGGGGMTFYSATQVYCAPKPAGNTMAYMWSGADVKAVLSKLGSGWGVCNPKPGYSSTSKCLEPGQTGGSSDWCGWWPPSSATMYSPMTGTTGSSRTCPSLDGSVEPPKPIDPPKPDICPKMPDVTSCPKGQVLVKETSAAGCVTPVCRPGTEVPPGPIACSAVVPITSCPPGQTLVRGSIGDCPNSYCVDIPGPPVPPIILPPGMNQCRMFREEIRSQKYEIRRVQQNLKYLPDTTEVPTDLKALLDRASASYVEIDSKLGQMAPKDCSAKYKELRAQVDAFYRTMDELRSSAKNVEMYQRIAQLQKDVEMRIRSIEQDQKRMGDVVDFAPDIKVYKELLEKVKKSRANIKDLDQFALEDLEFERSDIEQSLSAKYMQFQERGRDSYLSNKIQGIRDGIANARADIAVKNIGGTEQCLKVLNLFDQVENLATEARKAYDADDHEEAANILQKIERFELPVVEAAKQCGIHLSVDEKRDAIVDAVVDKISQRFNENLRTITLLNEKIEKLTTQLSEISEKFAAVKTKVEETLAQITSIPKEQREAVEKAKEAVINATKAAEEAAKSLAASQSRRLQLALERAAARNYCGDVASRISDHSASIQAKLTNNDLQAEDIATFESAIEQADRDNAAECYKVGASRYRDSDTAAWYFGYFQRSNAFKGGADGNVEPARGALRAEALIAIERALGIPEVDGDCKLTAKALDVPPWANCAVNKAAEYRINFFGPMNVSVTRDEVASWIVALSEGKVLPVDGSLEYVSKFKDLKACKTVDAVSDLVANKLMTGRNETQWGCAQPLVRAELAAVLERLSDLRGLTTATTVPAEQSGR